MTLRANAGTEEGEREEGWGEGDVGPSKETKPKALGHICERYIRNVVLFGLICTMKLVSH